MTQKIWSLKALAMGIVPFPDVILRGLGVDRAVTGPIRPDGYVHHSKLSTVVPVLAMIVAKDMPVEVGGNCAFHITGLHPRDNPETPDKSDWIVTVTRVSNNAVPYADQGPGTIDPTPRRSASSTKRWPASAYLQKLGQLVNAHPDTIVWNDRGYPFERDQSHAAAMAMAREAQNLGVEPGESLWTAINSFSLKTGWKPFHIQVTRTG